MFCGGKAIGGAQPVFRWKGNTGCAGIHGTEDGMRSVDTAIARCVRRLSCRLQYTASLRSMHGGVRNLYSFSRKLPTLASHPLSQITRPRKLPARTSCLPMQIAHPHASYLYKSPVRPQIACPCKSLTHTKSPARANRPPAPSPHPLNLRSHWNTSRPILVPRTPHPHNSARAYHEV